MSVNTPTTPRSDEASAELARLRALLFAPAQDQVDDLQHRLDDDERLACDVARVLPQAVALRTAQDDRLAGSLGPTIGEALHASIRENPEPVTEAIFPILGPAIRKSIAHAMSGLVESLNRSLEATFTVRGLRLRRKARRAGLTYAEALLRESLVYRVEQVFLIHADAGLLLQHVHIPDARAEDPDLVSGMLTAISDFVHDSFDDDEGATLDQFRVGERTVLVEAGPQAVLAAVVRGAPPTALRTALQRAVERIHMECRTALAAFEGDDAPFAPLRPLLGALLVAQRREAAPRGAWHKARRWLVAAATSLLLLVLAGLGARGCQRERARAHRVEAALAGWRAAPALRVLLAAQGPDGWEVTVAEDPEAVGTAAAIAAKHLLPRDPVRLQTLPQALPHAPLVLRRARRLLDPPEGVELSFDEEAGTLRLAGEATPDFLAGAAARASLLTEVRGVDDTRLVLPGWESLAEPAARLRDATIPFPRDSSSPGSATASALERLLEDVGTLAARAAPLGVRVLVDVRGAEALWDRDPAAAGIVAARSGYVAARLREGCPAIEVRSERDLVTGSGPRWPHGAAGDRSERVALDVRLRPLAPAQDAPPR
jgi:OOP family OmpA-OmpF porin